MGRKKRVPETSKHHRIAKSRGGAGDAPNCDSINHKLHVSLHKLFGNQHTLEKVESIFEMDEKILKDKYRYIIMDILETDPMEVFVLDAFRDKRAYEDLGDTSAFELGILEVPRKLVSDRITAKDLLLGRNSNTLAKAKKIIEMDAGILTGHFRKEIMEILSFADEDVFSKYYLEEGRESYEWWGKDSNGKIRKRKR